MTRRVVLSVAGAIVCIAWAVLTAWAYLRGKRPVPAPHYQEQEILPWDYPTTFTLSSGSTTTYTERPN